MAVSIHTPAWGTTHLEQELARIPKQFQSTRLREARPVYQARRLGHDQVSIHAPA